MSCFAIASDFEGKCRLFSGNINCGQWAPPTIVPGYFQPGHVENIAHAFLVRDRAAAATIATGLTELGQAFTFGDKRTWFVLELPSDKVPERADIDRAAQRRGRSA